jgi:hemoglobin/transferrin/lactoferrin receptor protein
MAWGKFKRVRAHGRCISAAVVGTTAMLSGMAATTPLIAQGAPDTNQSAQANVSFAIPAQPLASAIVAFSTASGLNIVSAGTIPASAQSSGVSGTLAPRQALTKLLAGTGYTYRFTGANSVTIVDPNADDAGATIEGAIALDTITVSGADAGTTAADLPFETPGSVAYISEDQIKRVMPTSTGDMLKSTPGVLSGGNRNGVSMNVNIRGMQGMNRVATSVDGALQQSSSYRGYGGHDSRVYVDPEFIAGIEVSKGPGAVAGAMGGAVNMRTLSARDIVDDGQTVGLRLRGGLANNNTLALDGTMFASGTIGETGGDG